MALARLPVPDRRPAGAFSVLAASVTDRSPHHPHVRPAGVLKNAVCISPDGPPQVISNGATPLVVVQSSKVIRAPVAWHSSHTTRPPSVPNSPSGARAVIGAPRHAQ